MTRDSGADVTTAGPDDDDVSFDVGDGNTGGSVASSRDGVAYVLYVGDDQETRGYRMFGEGGSGPAGEYETSMDGETGLSIVGAGVSICAPMNTQG